MSQALAKLEASIEAQQKKLAQLKAHKQKIEARQKAKLQGVARQQNTRRKILAGAMLLEMMAADAELQKRMLTRLSGFLTREDDRKLFGLAGGTSKTREWQRAEHAAMGLPGYGVRTAKRCEALPGRLLPAKSPVRLTGDFALDCGRGSTVATPNPRVCRDLCTSRLRCAIQ
jgi:large subunit ribosomal protein L7/L12